jgi:hypothetical protein
MKQQEIIENLKSLNSIEPNDKFARVSRSAIFSAGSGMPLEKTFKQGAFTRGLSFALSMALAAVFLFLLAAGNTTGPFKAVFLPTLQGVNNDSLASEADSVTKDIDIKLGEIQYFDQQTKKTVALAENPSSQATISTPDEAMAGEDKIDKLLDEVIEY